MEKGKSKLVRSQTVKHEVGQRPRPQTVAAASNHAMNRQNADLVRELRNNQIFKSQCYRLGKWDRRKSASLDDLRGEKPGTPPVAKEKSLSIASIEGGIVKRRVEILKTLEAVSDGNGNQKTSNRFPVSPTLEEPELRSSGQRPPRSHTIQILYGGTPKLSPNLPKSPKCDECSGTYEKVLKITGHGIDKKLPKGSLIKIDGGRIIIDEKGKREVLRENIQFESKRLEGKKFIVLVDSEKNHYQLQFDKEKDARQCLPPERTYIRDILRKLLRKRSSKDVLERKGIIRKEPIFGNTLKNLQDKFGTAIPKFVSDSIRLIEMPENITSQFLYRASGNLAIIQKIRFEVDRDKLDILNEYSKDVDVLTGALKLFFRELSDPLITHDIYSELIKLIGEECCSISTKVIKLLSRLPESHRETLLAIVNHLIKVERYKDDNKMDLYNLSVVWGPSLIWFPDKTLNENVLKTSSDAVKVMEMILNVYKGCPSPMLQKRIDSPMTPKLPYKFKSSSESLSSSTIHTERSDNLSHTDSFRENTSQSDESVNSTEVCYRSAMSKGVFGNSLENLEKISKEPLPEFVKRMVELIDSNIGCVGLYRQSGEKTKMDKIKAKIKKNKFSSLDKYSKDTMELACLLKHFFMELRTPLIPRAILDAFIKNFDLDEQDRRKLLLDDINSLPESHKTTLRFLLDHFSRVIDNKQNLMGKEAMCIVWAPVLCSIHNNDCDAAAARADKAAKLIEMLMDHYAPEEASKLEPMRNKSKSLYDNVRGEASLLDRDSVLLGAERTKL